MSRTNSDMPSVRCLTSLAFCVRAITSMMSASRAPEMNTFWPLSTHSSPSRVARLLMLKLLVPALGSVIAKQSFTEPSQVGVTNFLICSGVPWRTIGTRPRPVTTRNSVGTPPSASASASATISTTPPPLPPNFSGTERPSRPYSPIAFHMSSGNTSLSMHSRMYERGYCSEMPRVAS